MKKEKIEFGDIRLAANVGSWRVEFDEGKPPRMYPDATMLKLIGLPEDTDLSPEEIHRAWAERVDPAHVDALEEGTKYMIEGEQAEIQYPWHHPDGRTIIVRCGGVRDMSYQPGVRIIGIHQWVTTMKHVDRDLEEKQRQLKKALRDSSERLRRAEQLVRIRPLMVELQQVLLGDLTKQALTRTLEILLEGTGASRAYLVKYERDRGMIKLVGEACRDSSVIPAGDDFEYPASAEKGWDEVADDNYIMAPDVYNPKAIEKYGLLTESNRRLGIKSLYVVRLAVGNYNWGSVGITYEGEPHRILDYEWEFMHMVANMLQLSVVHDERRVELEKERDRARSADQAKSYFFSTVSHDIRTPLNAIIGYSELLKLGSKDEEEQKNAINSILMSGRSLLELINDVLDLSKLEAGQMEFIPEPVEVASLVREVVQAFTASVDTSQVELIAETSHMPWLRLDPRRIRQILFNLVGNSVKFTEKGHITVRAKYAKGTLRLEVEDTGCGISEADQLRIAQPFVQAGSRNDRQKGTGLGLTICTQLVNRMGGEIELESALGHGTTFYVTLPGVEEDSGRGARLSATQRIRFAVEGNKKEFRHVLVVDDQTLNRMVLKTMLEKFGIKEITLAENGVDALEKLKQNEELRMKNEECRSYDLVLTDMWMPEMDGEALIKEIRKNPEWKDLAVYAVTADVEAQRNCLKMGFTGLLLKPLTLEKLKEIVS